MCKEYKIYEVSITEYCDDYKKKHPMKSKKKCKHLRVEVCEDTDEEEMPTIEEKYKVEEFEMRDGKYHCICGKSIKPIKHTINYHRNSKKHKKYMEQIQHLIKN